MAAKGWLSRVPNPRRLPGWAWLLGAALLIYLFSRLVALAEYPIYFFTDEANQTLLALDFWRDGLRNYAGDFLPVYFKNVYQYNLSLSVYLQLLPALLFGRSIELTRGVPALVSALAPLWLALALRRVYASRYPWLAALFLAVTPAWFLHSRTAFETSLSVTFYCGFLYYYLRYRGGQLSAICPAVLAAALAFYSYSPAQVVVTWTAVLFFLTDLPYHWRSRRAVAGGFGLALACALPYLRFQLEHPAESLGHLHQLGSYWLAASSPLDKLGAYLGLYLRGLDAAYWLNPGQDIARHTMDGYGHLLVWTLPFTLGGLGLALLRWRRWEYRTPLLAVLAAPAGAALVGLGITRLLFMVAPLALLAGLAASEGLEWLARRRLAWRAPLAAGLWLGLAGFNLFLLGDALRNGPTWSTDYGLGGLQYGARQVFGEALRYTQAHPGAQVEVSNTWTNGADVVARFLLPEGAPVGTTGIDAWLVEQRPLPQELLFILTPEEYARVMDSGKFRPPQLEGSLPTPDGQLGFYLVHLGYVENIAEIFRAELADRQSLQTGQLTLASGEQLTVQYSRLDMGEIEHAFDGSPDTFIRSLAANPLRLRIQFAVPRPLRQVSLLIGGTASTLELEAGVPDETQPRSWQREVPAAAQSRRLVVDLEGTPTVSWLELRLKNTFDMEPGHVHLWEITIE